jgi:hypothetical protein
MTVSSGAPLAAAERAASTATQQRRRLSANPRTPSSQHGGGRQAAPIDIPPTRSCGVLEPVADAGNPTGQSSQEALLPALLAGGFPAVPDALKQPALTLGVLLGGVSRVDLSRLAINDLVRAVCLSHAVGQDRHLLESAIWHFVGN